MLLSVTSIFARGKADWRGKVVDSNGEPVAYANVAVLSKTDSTLVCGAITAEDGTFNIITDETDGIMMVAMLGYRTVYVVPADGAVITLLEDSTLLEGAVATAIMPKTKLTGEGLQTNVRGSVLENAGSANDVLAKTPGVVKGADGIEVIGKGAPLVYINGHKVSDASELDRLQSNEIQSIEVITNPGAQYDASVRSVVRIRTIRRQGEGFGFSLDASDAQSLQWAKGNDPFGALNANYRIGGVDFFAGVNFDGNTSRQISDIYKTSFGRTADGDDWTFQNNSSLYNEYFGSSLYGNAGVNWQLSANHFMGAKMEWGRTLSTRGYMVVDDEVSENGTPVNTLHTESEDFMGDVAPYNIGANVYYNGVIGKMGVDVNMDYYETGFSKNSRSEESGTATGDDVITSESTNIGRMVAAKAILSYPVWRGQLQVGTEETISSRTDDYSITGVDIIPASSALVKEQNYAGFATYGFMLPFGMFNAGVRYEYVHYAYEDALSPGNNITRNFSNWFPNVSFAGMAGPVQMMLNYSAKTERPHYFLLSSAIQYNSRYIWQSGDAQLQPQITHDVSATAVWKFVTFMLNYSRTNDAILTWSAPYGDDGVILVKPRNLDTPYRALSAFLVFTPTIGPWSLNYTVGVQPQWLTINAPDTREASGSRAIKFNDKPMYMGRFDNTFTVKGGWQFELGATMLSPCYMRNIEITNFYCDVNAAIQKTLLKDGSLVLRLEGRDLLNMAHQNADTDFGNHTIIQNNMMDMQKVKFSLRYRFNTVQSKYRGTGAGSDSRGRM